jgi:hypothetical protein
MEEPEPKRRRSEASGPVAVCAATFRSGVSCTFRALKGGVYCGVHVPKAPEGQPPAHPDPDPDPEPEPEPEPEARPAELCAATFRSGANCTFRALKGGVYCGVHAPKDPDGQGQQGPPAQPDPEPEPELQAAEPDARPAELCAGTFRSGASCTFRALKGGVYCGVHASQQAVQSVQSAEPAPPPPPLPLAPQETEADDDDGMCVDLATLDALYDLLVSRQPAPGAWAPAGGYAA